MSASTNPSPVPLSAELSRILIASDAWGTRAVLDVCEGLPREAFHRRFEIGLGSLHDTLTHMVSTMRRWTDRLAGRAPRAMLHAVPGFPNVSGEAKDRTAGEIRVLLDEAERDLLETAAAIVSQSRLGVTIKLEWPGTGAEEGFIKTYTFTLGAVIAHVTTHGYHHRAQCLNMLRQLGAPVPGVTEGLPEPSAVDWQAAVESPAEVWNVEQPLRGRGTEVHRKERGGAKNAEGAEEEA